MANNRVYEADLTIPAGTQPNAPVTSTVPLPLGTIVKVTLVVPPGPAGNTGWALLLSGTRIIPYAGASWIVADDYSDTWELDQDVNPGQVQVAGYNTDVFQHTVYLRILFSSSQPGVPVAASLASSGGPAPNLTGLGSQSGSSSPGATTGSPGGSTGSPAGTTSPSPGAAGSSPGGTTGAGGASSPAGTTSSPAGSVTPSGTSSPPAGASGPMQVRPAPWQPAPAPLEGPRGGRGWSPAPPAKVTPR